MRKPIALWFLVVSLIFLAFGGLYGGILMLTDPSGRSLQMDSVLPQLLVPNYVLPGLFLLFVMGLAPLFLTFSLLARPKWIPLPILFRHYWAWTATLALGIVLILWLTLQAFLIGFQWPIQYVTAVNGLLIVLLTLIPQVRKHFEMIKT
ncbi:MAG: hypothetical protein DPW18_01475 [Chloroflexi bacterium]|nr:hypothetical protein [Chloroflexota bacterium]MDL1940822.1 hypothetical protein [Chloroflexi bacterium CFX2]